MKDIINQPKYAHKHPFEKEVKRFEVRDEVRVITALTKFFDKITVPISEEEALKRDNLALLEPANVCLIQAKTEEAKRCLSRFIDKNDTCREAPELQYNTKENDGEIKSSYSIEYFNPIINLFKATKDEKFSIKINVDYPATLENEHFKVTLAPRIEVDD